ncbi:hypothetical protein NON00_02430 [Roseomonas sp. GC11]|uniref:hypothetical protein n=1 Tax=Roseomonas sp. GC11 TaxID=2950546 RepID=UPI00210E4347|nr:hypothetical protein [Roseomonas sp. GC11]MCQ4158784.1 hypothetical protein [Roseomonas sp. GC11]
MSERKPRPKIHQSRVGTGVWPKVNKPDTKFKAEGEYTVKLRLSDEDVADIRRQIEDALPEAKAAAQEVVAEALKKKKRMTVAAEPTLPITPEVDEEGNDTGTVLVKFGTKASWKDRKTGEIKYRVLPLFNAKGRPTKAEVWSGSKLKVAYTLNPWANPKAEYGVSLRLEAVQIIELAGPGQRDASGYGFGAEDGYDGEGEDHSTDTTGSDDDDTDGGSADF